MLGREVTYTSGSFSRRYLQWLQNPLAMVEPEEVRIHHQTAGLEWQPWQRNAPERMRRAERENVWVDGCC